jgi:hypothetical protein
MTGWSGRRRRLAASAAVLLYAVGTVMSCARREKVQRGVDPVDNDRQLVVSSLGSCGCVTFTNMRKDAVTLISGFKGEPIGRQKLEPGDPVHVRFDWAGPDAKDVYHIFAYDALTKATRGEEARVPFGGGSVTFAGVTEVRCSDDEACEFGSMNMNRAAAAAMGQDEVAAAKRGVRQTTADEVLEVSAARDQCGCLLMRNEAMETVFVTSTLRGRAVGGLAIHAGGERYVGFDWAGDSSTDVYRLTALIPGSSGRAGEASGSTSAKPTPDLPDGTLAESPAETTSPATPRTFERLVKFAPDGLRIIGRFDGLSCTKPVADHPLDRTIAEKIPHDVTGQRAVHPNGAELPLPSGHEATCPFDDLNMNQIWSRSAPLLPAPTAKPAQAGGQKD